MPSLQPYPKTNEYNELWEGIKKILEYLFSSQLQETLFPLKIIFIFISIFFLIVIIWFLCKTEYIRWWFWFDLKNFLFPKPLGTMKLNRKWEKIKKNLEKGKLESQWKISLIESLEILDKTLKNMGYSGENLTERLSKLSSDEVSNLDDLFRAQRICQDVVRDPNYRLTKEQAQEIIEIFEKALVNLEVL